MSDKQWLAVGLIVVVYLWWHQKGVSRYATTTGTRHAGVGSGTITGASSVSITPKTRRQLPTLQNPWSKGGNSLVIAPVQRIGKLNNPGRANIGTNPRTASTISQARTRNGIVGVSNVWPRNQVTSTRSIPVGKGRVQVPSWTAVPTITQGPGGAGTVLNVG